MLNADLFVLARDTYPKLPYHNFGHAMDVLAEIRRLRGLLRTHFPDVDAMLDGSALDAAALFHDVIYVPGRPDNESLSADLAAGALGTVGVAQADIERVVGLIEMTEAHQPDPSDWEACLLSDADMAGFAAPLEQFVANNVNVDAEFLEVAGVDPGAYAAGRRGFLESTLSAARDGELFFVPVLQEERHAIAVANLERALAEMR